MKLGEKISQFRSYHGGQVMSSANNHEKRLRESMERMKLLKAGGEIDCPLCKKGKVKMRTPATFLCDYCGKGIIIDYKIPDLWK